MVPLFSYSFLAFTTLLIVSTASPINFSPSKAAMASISKCLRFSHKALLHCGRYKFANSSGRRTLISNVQGKSLY